MMRNIILFLVLSFLIGCDQTEKKQALYFFYHGDKRISYYHLVLKEDSQTVTSNLMLVGKPIVLLLPNDEISSLLRRIGPMFLQTDSSSTLRGVSIIQYVNGLAEQTYIFYSKKDIAFLKEKIQGIKNSTVKDKTLDWITSIEKIYPFLE